MIDTITFFLWNLHILLESLPISSSSHMHLLCNFFFRNYAINSEQELMHLPTLVVIGCTVAYLAAYGFTSSTATFLLTEPYALFSVIAIADSITGVAYIALKKNPLIPKKFPLAVGLFISALALLSLYYCPFGNLSTITPWKAALIGLAQSFALLPGISRLALTIVTATWLGIDPLLGALFSIIIEFPLIAAAITKEIIQSPEAARSFYALSFPQLLMLIASTALSSLLLIGVIILHLHHQLYFFGWYLGALFFLLSWNRLHR